MKRYNIAGGETKRNKHPDRKVRDIYLDTFDTDYPPVVVGINGRVGLGPIHDVTETLQYVKDGNFRFDLDSPSEAAVFNKIHEVLYGKKLRAEYWMFQKLHLLIVRKTQIEFLLLH